MRKNTICIIIAFYIIFSTPCLSFDPKNHFPFKKKQPVQKQKMVETKQEWEIEAKNVPLSERNNETIEEEKSTKKYYQPTPHYVFEKYNYPQGKRQLNIEDVKKNLYSYPYIVSDINCHYVAYPRYYFSPDIKQISSNFYVEKLDTTKTKTKRILDYDHNQLERKAIIQAGTKETYPNLFNGLTLVDWSADSKKLLIKEQVGSTLNGIYKTYLYIHFLGNENQESYTIKLLDLDNAIKNYYLDWENLQLIKYRYDIEPLGFSADNDNLIIVLSYVYDKNNKKIFLGAWSYNCYTHEIILLSKTNTIYEISANGLILRRSYD